MSPLHALALTLGCSLVVYAAYRGLKWLANYIISTIEYLLRFEER